MFLWLYGNISEVLRYISTLTAWNELNYLLRKALISVFALAKGAGLDAAALNKSKRQLLDGQPRWISTGTLRKILEIINTKFSDFAIMIENNSKE